MPDPRNPALTRSSKGPGMRDTLREAIDEAVTFVAVQDPDEVVDAVLAALGAALHGSRRTQRDEARDKGAALRSHEAFGAGWSQGFAAALEALTSDAPVEAAAAADYQLLEGSPWVIGKVPMEEAAAYLTSARAALAAAAQAVKQGAGDE